MTPRRLVLCALLIASTASFSHAWSYKEHIQFARLAAMRLIADPTTPPEMKAWLERAVPNRLDLAGEKEYFLRTKVGTKPEGYTGVLRWVYMPDEHSLHDPRDSKVSPFGAHEKLMHYIDLELMVTGDAKRGYRDDLSGKPKLADVVKDAKNARYVQAGYLPFRVDQSYQELVRAIRENRLDEIAGDNDENAVRWAGYLAHYVSDNTQPHHATVDYRSATYFPKNRKAPNIHNAMEFMMIDDEKQDYPALRAEFWPLFEKHLVEMKDAAQSADMFDATVQVAFASYDALPLIGAAAVFATTPAAAGEKADAFDLEKFFRFKGKMLGEEMSVMEMKARQTAWAVLRIETVWKKAWIDAAGAVPAK